MRKLGIIIVWLGFVLAPGVCGNELPQEVWEKEVKGIDYTETYREFERKPKEQKPVGPFKFSGENMKVVIIVLVMGALLVLVIKLITLAYNTKTIKTIEPSGIKVDEDNPDEHNLTDLEKWLQQAVGNEDYRLAIRIMFLMLIKNLNDKSIISWKKKKTNRDYFLELKDKSYSGDFKLLTGVFEKVWYAQYDVSYQNYERASQSFNNVNEKINGEQ